MQQWILGSISSKDFTNVEIITDVQDIMNTLGIETTETKDGDKSIKNVEIVKINENAQRKIRNFFTSNCTSQQNQPEIMIFKNKFGTQVFF